MIQEKTLFTLANWKLYHSELVKDTTIKSFKKDQITKENSTGYIVAFIETNTSENNTKVECYKKHSTSILKSIIIGKFQLADFHIFKKEIDAILPQSTLLVALLQKPEFSKHKLQRKLYFNID